MGRLSRPSPKRQGEGQAVVGAGVIRPQGNGRTETRHRLIGPTRGHEHGSQSVEDLGIIRFDLIRLLQDRESVFDLAPTVEQEGKLDESSGEIFSMVTEVLRWDPMGRFMR